MASDRVLPVVFFSVDVTTTYQNELMDSLTLCITVAGILIFIVGCIVIVANVFALVSVAMILSRNVDLQSSRLNTSYVFVFNLALADLLVGIASAFIFAINLSNHGGISYHACLVQMCFTITPCMVSVFTMTIIGLDRYFCIMHPFKYDTFISLSKGLFIITAAWILSTIYGFAPIMGWSVSMEQYINNGGVCSFLYVVDSSYVMYIFFGIFLPQLILIIYLYVKIFKVSRGHRKKMTQIKLPQSRLSQQYNSCDSTSTLHRSLPAFTQSCPSSPSWAHVSDSQTQEIKLYPKQSDKNKRTPSVSFSPNYSENQTTFERSRSSVTKSMHLFNTATAGDSVFEYSFNLPGNVCSPQPTTTNKPQNLCSNRSCCNSSTNNNVYSGMKKSASYAGTLAISSITLQSQHPEPKVIFLASTLLQMMSWLRTVFIAFALSKLSNRIKSCTALRKTVVNSDVKSLRTIALVVGFFFLMWTPFLIVSAVQVICASRCELQALVGSYLFLLGIANSAINPIVYIYTHKELKKQIAKLCCKKARSRVVTDHEPSESFPETLPNCSSDFLARPANSERKVPRGSSSSNNSVFYLSCSGSTRTSVVSFPAENVALSGNTNFSRRQSYQVFASTKRNNSCNEFENESKIHHRLFQPRGRKIFFLGGRENSRADENVRIA